MLVSTSESELTSVPRARVGAVLAATLHAGQDELPAKPCRAFPQGALNVMVAISCPLRSLYREDHCAPRKRIPGVPVSA